MVLVTFIFFMSYVLMRVFRVDYRFFEFIYYLRFFFMGIVCLYFVYLFMEVFEDVFINVNYFYGKYLVFSCDVLYYGIVFRMFS